MNVLNKPLQVLLGLKKLRITTTTTKTTIKLKHATKKHTHIQFSTTITTTTKEYIENPFFVKFSFLKYTKATSKHSTICHQRQQQQQNAINQISKIIERR